jgi:hypothetical protein
MKQIPKEGEAFRQTNAIWCAAMENTKRNPALMTVADMPNLLQNFQQVHFTLSTTLSLRVQLNTLPQRSESNKVLHAGERTAGDCGEGSQCIPGYQEGSIRKILLCEQR